MKNQNQWHVYSLSIFLFFVLNILNTYVLTVQELNRYIAPFRHSFLGELNAFIGNFSILFFMITIAFIVIKKAKSRMLFLIVVTFLLNFFIFWMGVFNLFFGTSFSIPAASIFRNPSEGFAMGTFWEAMLQLITYYRIIVFLPFFALLIIYLFSDRVQLSMMYFKITIKKVMIAVLIVIITFFTAVFSYYEQFQETLPLNSVKSTYAIQHLGVYPYYVGEFFGQPFDVDLQAYLELESEEALAEAYQSFNKNKPSYTNFLDQERYSNRLTIDQAVPDLEIDDSLFDGNNLHGILEGRNLVLIHLESLNQFLFEHPAIKEELSFVLNLMNESFVFTNFYNNVGMGVSSDAELSVLTGLYPMGDRTLYWQFDDIDFELKSLVGYFNQYQYQTQAIHGDHASFYNRDHVYADLYGFDDYYALDDFVEDGYVIEDGYVFDEANHLIHHSPWISDFHLFDQTNLFGHAYIDQDTPFMMFPIMMMPHTPFDYDPYGYREDLFPEYQGRIQRITMKYINYAQYIDETLTRLFIGADGEDQTLDNTVYVFYSDHGSGIKNGDLSTLFDKDYSVIETRKILQQVPAWIYVPGDDYVTYGDYQIRQGLIKGEQPLVRSQVDLYRTIIELFDLPVGSDPYFGVHGMSTEPTFALDNRLMDVVTDDFFYSMRNTYYTVPEAVEIPSHVFRHVLRFKQLSDIMVSKGDMQRIIYQAMERIYGP